MKEQLLQSDKMASIGQLAAGVAHEINNPIGFIASNLNRLDEYAKDIIHLVEMYQCLAQDVEKDPLIRQKLSTSVANVRAVESETDVAFLCEDLTEMIHECRDGAKRVGQIVYKHYCQCRSGH